MISGSGIYRGTTLSSNEASVGLPDGSVTRARALSRIRPGQRWRPGLIQNITGTPNVPCNKPDDSIIEPAANPNLYLGEQQRVMLER